MFILFQQIFFTGGLVILMSFIIVFETRQFISYNPVKAHHFLLFNICIRSTKRLISYLAATEKETILLFLEHFVEILYLLLFTQSKKTLASFWS